MGVLRWSPKRFWKSTPYELRCALDGYLESKGGKRQAPGMTRERLEELMAEYPD